VDIAKDWNLIRSFVNDTAKRCVFASADAEGAPHLTVIGSLFLTTPGSGFYFEKYPTTLPAHLAENPRLCILAMHMSFCSFLKGMARGRLTMPPGLRLHAEAGVKRAATREEIALFSGRVRLLRPLRGYSLLWGEMRHVREVRVCAADALTVGPLTRGVDFPVGADQGRQA